MDPKWIALGLQLARVPLDILSTGIRVSEGLIMKTLSAHSCAKGSCQNPAPHFCGGCERNYCCEDFDHTFGACFSCRNEAAEAAAREASLEDPDPSKEGEGGEDEGDRGGDTINRIRFPQGDSLN